MEVKIVKSIDRISQKFRDGQLCYLRFNTPYSSHRYQLSERSPSRGQKLCDTLLSVAVEWKSAVLKYCEFMGHVGMNRFFSLLSYSFAFKILGEWHLQCHLCHISSVYKTLCFYSLPFLSHLYLNRVLNAGTYASIPESCQQEFDSGIYRGILSSK